MFLKFVVFLPRKYHGQKSLVGYSPWGRKRVRHKLAMKEQGVHNKLASCCILGRTVLTSASLVHISSVIGEYCSSGTELAELIAHPGNTINNCMADCVLGPRDIELVRLSLCLHVTLLFFFTPTHTHMHACTPLFFYPPPLIFLLFFLFLPLTLTSLLCFSNSASSGLHCLPHGPSLSLLLVKKKMKEGSWGTQRGLDSPEVTGLEEPRSVGTDEDIRVASVFKICFSPFEHVPGEGFCTGKVMAVKGRTKPPHHPVLLTLQNYGHEGTKGQLGIQPVQTRTTLRVV